MKNLKTTIAIFALAIALFSCSKKEDSETPIIAPEQNPFAGYLVATGFYENTRILTNNRDFEFGFSFIPKVNGKITAIVVKQPEAKADLRVTIWDFATETPIRTINMGTVLAGIENTKIIAPIDLAKDKKYLISMNTNHYYIHQKSDFSEVVYPFLVGDIEITNYLEKEGTNQILPTFISNSGILGDCSFKFQK